MISHSGFDLVRRPQGMQMRSRITGLIIPGVFSLRWNHCVFLQLVQTRVAVRVTWDTVYRAELQLYGHLELQQGVCSETSPK